MHKDGDKLKTENRQMSYCNCHLNKPTKKRRTGNNTIDVLVNKGKASVKERSEGVAGSTAPGPIYYVHRSAQSILL